MLCVSRLFKDTTIEMQPGQLAVDEPRRLRSQRAIRGWRSDIRMAADRRDFFNRGNSLAAISHLKGPENRL
jgi:hypothetical protein